MKQLIITFILLLAPLTAYSQATLEWASRYDGPGSNNDNSNDIVLDAQGNVYVTGYCVNAANTSTDIATLKYNPAGVQQWAAVYNGQADSTDIAYSIGVDAAGNVYIAGESIGIGTNADFIVIKYNSAGAEQWVKRVNGTRNNVDIAIDMEVSAQGDIVVTGYTNDSTTFDNYITLKYNSAGVELWRAIYSGPGLNDEASNLALDAAGNVYVTGKSISNNFYDYLTIKYNSAGVQQWTARKGVFLHDETPEDIAVDAQGNVYVTGTDAKGVDSVSYLTVKYNTAGVEQWSRNFLGADAQRDLASNIGVDQSGNVFVTGSSYRSGQGSNYGTVKYSNDGTFQWAAYYLGTGSASSTQTPYDLEVDAAGNVYVAGYDNTIAYTVKYSPDGVQLWRAGYGPTPYYDAFFAMALDASNNVYMTGPSATDTVVGLDYATVKFSQTTGIQNISTEIPSKFFLSQNYPNPFNPETNIEFAVPIAGYIKLSVYNSLGKEVGVLVNQELNAGTYNYDWNASVMPSGVYFYTLRSESFTETKKMLLVK